MVKERKLRMIQEVQTIGVLDICGETILVIITKHKFKIMRTIINDYFS